MTARDLTPVECAPGISDGLSRQEDDELRRLNYFGEVGTLAGSKLERFAELRLRDRRKEIRAPREFGEDKSSPTGSKRGRWLRSRRKS